VPRGRRLIRESDGDAATDRHGDHRERIAAVVADHGPARGDTQRGAEHDVARKMPIVDQA
jgi:hypothetical protein